MKTNSPSANHNLPGGTLPNPSLNDIPEVHLFHPVRLDTRALHRMLDCGNPKLWRFDGSEHPIDAADGRARGGENKDGLDGRLESARSTLGRTIFLTPVVTVDTERVRMMDNMGRTRKRFEQELGNAGVRNFRRVPLYLQPAGPCTGIDTHSRLYQPDVSLYDLWTCMSGTR